MVAAAVVAHIFWTSAAPALTYRLYAAQWHLTPTATTAIFAVYPVVVVAVLIGFGDLSDRIGRRAAMLLGLGASLVGTFLFAVAPAAVGAEAALAGSTTPLGGPGGALSAAASRFAAAASIKQTASDAAPAAACTGFRFANVVMIGTPSCVYEAAASRLGARRL